MGYDLGILVPDLADQLQDTPLANWPVVNQDPLIRTRTLQGKTIAFLFFPNPDTEAEWEILQQRIREQAAELKEQADLCIGFSPWGKSREQAFLQRHSGVLDLLLGSGPGGTVRNEGQNATHTLWIRPYSKGKVVNSVFLPEWPTPGPHSGRLSPEAISAETFVLDESVEADADLSALFAGGP